MQVEITVGVQKPDQVNKEEVAKQIPYGSVIVNAEVGGLNVEDEQNKTVTVIANAAIAARYDLPDGQFAIEQ